MLLLDKTKVPKQNLMVKRYNASLQRKSYEFSHEKNDYHFGGKKDEKDEKNTFTGSQKLSSYLRSDVVWIESTNDR